MTLLRRTTLTVFLLASLVSSAYSMGSTPQIPADLEAPADLSAIGTDMMNVALTSFRSSMGSGIDMQSLLSSFLKSDFITLGEHNGTTVAVAPCMSGGIMGLTFRLTFNDAVVDIPVDPAKPGGEKKAAPTIASGVMDITAGVDLAGMKFSTITLCINTPETLVLADGNGTDIEFQDVKCGFDIMSNNPTSPGAYAVSGTVIVDGYTVDIAMISDLVALMASGI
ncbi:hypothetical protein JCM14469_35170 [Desulfatiferula olefinivorans]